MDREPFKRKVAAALADLGIDFGSTSREWAAEVAVMQVWPEIGRLEAENEGLRGRADSLTQILSSTVAHLKRHHPKESVGQCDVLKEAEAVLDGATAWAGEQP